MGSKNYSGISRRQYDSFRANLDLLEKLSIIGHHYVVSNSYYDTVVAYRKGYADLSVDATLTSFYAIESVIFESKM